MWLARPGLWLALSMQGCPGDAAAHSPARRADSVRLDWEVLNVTRDSAHDDDPAAVVGLRL